MANRINIAKLNVRHLDCKHGFLSIQYSKPPIKNLTNGIFRANCQLADNSMYTVTLDDQVQYTYIHCTYTYRFTYACMCTIAHMETRTGTCACVHTTQIIWGIQLYAIFTKQSIIRYSHNYGNSYNWPHAQVLLTSIMKFVKYCPVYKKDMYTKHLLLVSYS